MSAVERIERDGYVGEILIEEHPENPRFQFDHLTVMVQLSRDFMEPDQDPDWRKDKLHEAWARWGDLERVERYARAFLGAVAFDSWDDPRSSSRVIAMFPAEKAGETPDPGKYLQGELSEYVGYVNGDVYGYNITGPNGEDVGSCWGFYGDRELDYVRTQITDEIEAHRAAVHAAHAQLYRQLVNAGRS